MKNAILSGVAALLLLSCGEVRQKEADLILHNATVYTVNTAFTKAEAVAVKNGKIIDVGAEREILNRYQSQNKIDCKRAYVYPGFHTEVHARFQKDFDIPALNKLAESGVTSTAIYGGKKLPALLRADSSVLTKNTTYYPANVETFEDLHRDDKRHYNLNGIFTENLKRVKINETITKGIPLHVYQSPGDTALKMLTQYVNGTNDERRALHLKPNDRLELIELLSQNTIIPAAHYLHKQLPELLGENKILVLTGGKPTERFQGAVASRLAPRDALRALTIWPAILHFNESKTGSIEKGKNADFTILNTDLTAENQVTPKVLYTIIHGKIVYKHD